MANAVDVLPDAEAVAIDWLLADDAMQALVVDRVSAESDAEPAYPYVTIQRIGGIPSVRRRLDSARLQCSAWAETREQANLVARTARAVLHRMEGHSLAEAVVTAVDDDLGLISSPDTVRTPPTPRYIFGVVVHLHAV